MVSFPAPHKTQPYSTVKRMGFFYCEKAFLSSTKFCLPHDCEHVNSLFSLGRYEAKKLLLPSTFILVTLTTLQNPEDANGVGAFECLLYNFRHHMTVSSPIGTTLSSTVVRERWPCGMYKLLWISKLEDAAVSTTPPSFECVMSCVC
jgi:hypothetical protein